jgi:hypothetical protein
VFAGRGVEHPLQHPPCLVFVVAVVHYFAAVAAALAAEDLLAGRGAEQEDVSPADAVTPVELWVPT